MSSNWIDNLNELLNKNLDPNQSEIWEAIWGDEKISI
jgi:hypothetical protein